MKSVVKFYSILSLLFVAACSDELNKKDEAPKVTTLADDSFSSEVTPTDEANKYLVTIRWQKAGAPLLITNLENKKRITVSEDSNEFSDLVEGGRTYKYKVELQAASSSSGVSTVVLAIPVPFDFVLSGERTLSGDLIVSAERIFIRSNTFIRSRRYQILLKSKEIIAEGGSFQNYGQGEKDCPTVFDGMAGGNITIESEAASGTLNVIMKGADACTVNNENVQGGHGGAGGKLTVRVKQGQRLQLNLNFGIAKGYVPRAFYEKPGNLGAMPTSCIALQGETSCDQ